MNKLHPTVGPVYFVPRKRIACYQADNANKMKVESYKHMALRINAPREKEVAYG